MSQKLYSVENCKKKYTYIHISSPEMKMFVSDKNLKMGFLFDCGDINENKS